jgi:3-methyladenine DNA glycosylase AlkD
VNGFESVISELEKMKDPVKSGVLNRFFKTGKGQYGEGDIFWGIVVPTQRNISRKYAELPLADVKKLIKQPVHEFRLTALLILIIQYRKAAAFQKKKIIDLYLSHTKYINNWDLVDLSAPYILGNYLLDKNPEILSKLANSSSLWERRIAMISTFEFIKSNRFDEAIKIAQILLNDKEDLIHKAVGWMLREIGKRDSIIEDNFLNKYAKVIPRTALRYAIERFPEQKRQFYLGRK